MKVYSVADNISSPLGATTSENVALLKQNTSAIALSGDPLLSPQPVYVSRLSEDLYNRIKINDNFTYLENLIIHSIQNAIRSLSGSLSNSNTILVLSSTKGNIDLISSKQNSKIDRKRVNLPVMAEKINEYFHLPGLPVVVSNACISGVSALLTAKKLISSGQCDHAIVSGADMISEFVVSGFQSFMAISDKPCKPYDKDRNGITLGEAAGTIILSNDPELSGNANAVSIVSGGGQSNDANHISGPSRTGEGLKIAVEKALLESKLEMSQIDYINAHGTATEYNDEMESQAFNGLGASQIPLNSLKGYYGHTLGASGTIESIVSIWQMNQNLVLKSQGFETLGLTQPLNVIKDNLSKEIRYALKTSSGFGGCNAAIIFEKYEPGH